MYHRSIKPVISFITESKFYDLVLPPLPARALLPDWWKTTSIDTEDKTLTEMNNGTVKRCAPFLDAISAGYIFRLHHTIHIEWDSNNDYHVTWKPFEDMPVFEGHSAQQHPDAGRPEGFGKFLTPWTMKTQPGYSCLITNPLNSLEDRFQVFSGIVDTDSYFNPVNFPFTWLRQFSGDIKTGTPIAQVIPFRRESWQHETRAMTSKEETEIRAVRHSLMANRHAYNDRMWHKKKWK